MSDGQEDMNAFNSWDCFGAALMLGVTPGIICYATTTPHDLVGAIWYCVIGVLIALVVLAVALITRWRMLSSIVNMVGTCLTVFYIIFVTSFWIESCQKKPEAEQQSTAEQAPGAPRK